MTQSAETVEVLRETALGRAPDRTGKVRDIYELGDRLMIVSTDRLSAFDVVLPGGIPYKGRVLTQLSTFWFERFAGRVNHHLEYVVGERVPDEFAAFREQLRDRAMVCRTCEVVPIECVVRGYLAGSGWKEYQQTQSVCGVALPAGLRQADRLPEPIFTPATKATTGHDENISFERAGEIAGREVMETLRDRSMELYQAAAEHTATCGLILADTKLEWGYRDGELVLVDEIFTPDSSRYWPADEYEPGRDQRAFDKQYVRDYLETLDWDKKPPGPALPAEVAAQTSAKYIEAYERLTGRRFER